MKPRKLYDWKWHQASARFRKRNPICAVVGCGARSEVVDHIVPIRSAPHRKFDPTNWQALCARHHNILTNAYDKGSIAGACDADGLPLDPSHPWNAVDNAAAIKAANTKAKPSAALLLG